MEYYVGLDVSLKSTHICVMGGDRRVVWHGVSDTQIEMISARLARWSQQIKLVGLETGSLTPWLYHGLRGHGLPMVCMDARRASDAMKARAEKTDKADARALAEMLASGWYSSVHVKSLESHRLKALLGARDQLVRVKRQLYGQLRGLLRPFGIKIARRAGAKRFDADVRAACNREDVLYIAVSALLDTLASVEGQIAGLDKQVRSLAQKRKPCWHLMSVPGIGPITALAFVTTIEDPHRFGSNRCVASYLGLTPKRYQSGERDVSLSISRQGDEMVRHYLYEAANCLLTTVTGASALKSWGLKLVKRCGAKRARVAVARKLAVLLLRLWKQESHFEAQPA
jgi:transposase